MEFIREFWEFLKVRKKFWLAPIILTMLLLGSLIVLTEGSAVARRPRAARDVPRGGRGKCAVARIDRAHGPVGEAVDARVDRAAEHGRDRGQRRAGLALVDRRRRPAEQPPRAALRRIRRRRGRSRRRTNKEEESTANRRNEK